jgi:hypothetical protein
VGLEKFLEYELLLKAIIGADWLKLIVAIEGLALHISFMDLLPNK